MATVNAVQTYLDQNGRLTANTGAILNTWSGLAAGDDGAPIDLAAFADRSVQVAGTFDGATVEIHGTVDGTNYVVLSDPQGNALSFSTAKIEAVTELVYRIKPVVSGGGASTNLTVSLIARRDV